MKHGLHSLGALVLLGGIVVAGSALGAEPPVGQKLKESTTPTVKQRMRLVILECKNPGTHQDIAKTPDIKNTTTKTMPKGHKINWAASDGDKGVITLDKDLPAGQVVQGVSNKPAIPQSYTCTASTSSF